MGSVPCAASSFGFTKRQPSVVSNTVWLPRPKASVALPITSGARVIDSTPPAITRSASPVAISRAASATACRPEPHSRFTVTPGTVVGNPDSSADIRATLRLSSPAWFAQPMITSSMRSPGIFVRAIRAAIT